MRRSVRLYWWLIVLVLAAILLPAHSEDFRFVVLGDTRTWGNFKDKTRQPDQFKRNIQEINQLDPDFAVDVGDLILGYRDDVNMINRMWDVFDETVAKFEVPLYLVVGNHDVWNHVSQSIYQKRYGDIWYSWDHKGAHFVAMDSDEAGYIDHVSPSQLKWLRKDLAAHRDAKYTFVFLHKPLWARRWYRSEEWKKNVHPILKEFGVDMVFAGHVHIYRDFGEIDGIRYIVTGGGGAEVNATPWTGGFHHYVCVSVRDKGIKLAVVPTGSVESPDIVTESAVVRITKTLKALGPLMSSPLLGPVKEDLVFDLPNQFEAPVPARLAWANVPAEWDISPSRMEMNLAPGTVSKAVFSITAPKMTEFPEKTPFLRATYHFPRKGGKSLEVKADVYPRIKHPVAAELDLGQLDDGRALKRVEVADGRTLVRSEQGIEGRANNPNSSTPSRHIYVALDDRIGARGSCSELWVKIEYFDDIKGRGIAIQYDALGEGVGNIYRTTGTVTGVGDKKWKTRVFRLQQAFLGNRQNNSADLRIVCDPRDRKPRPLLVNRIWMSDKPF